MRWQARQWDWWISAFANRRVQATTIVPLALVPQLILAGVLVPKLPDLATAVAKIAVSGYWLTEAMKSVFIAAEGPIRIMNALHTGMLINMTAEPKPPTEPQLSPCTHCPSC